MNMRNGSAANSAADEETGFVSVTDAAKELGLKVDELEPFIQRAEVPTPKRSGAHCLSRGDFIKVKELVVSTPSGVETVIPPVERKKDVALTFDEVIETLNSENADLHLDGEGLKRLVSQCEIRCFREGEEKMFLVRDVKDLGRRLKEGKVTPEEELGVIDLSQLVSASKGEGGTNKPVFTEGDDADILPKIDPRIVSRDPGKSGVAVSVAPATVAGKEVAVVTKPTVSPGKPSEVAVVKTPAPDKAPAMHVEVAMAAAPVVASATRSISAPVESPVGETVAEMQRRTLQEAEAAEVLARGSSTPTSSTSSELKHKGETKPDKKPLDKRSVAPSAKTDSMSASVNQPKRRFPALLLVLCLVFASFVYALYVNRPWKDVQSVAPTKFVDEGKGVVAPPIDRTVVSASLAKAEAALLESAEAKREAKTASNKAEAVDRRVDQLTGRVADGEMKVNLVESEVFDALRVGGDLNRRLSDIERRPNTPAVTVDRPVPEGQSASAVAPSSGWTTKELAIARRLISRLRMAEDAYVRGQKQRFDRQTGWAEDELRNWSAASKRPAPTRDELDEAFPVRNK